ncbi:hypothetical protein DFJ77DRAFT_479125 [Powellomyces hirtus]|nr:hypothetical protein DFJ77DRAFT_479125 [Powellomyces hirtus]
MDAAVPAADVADELFRLACREKYATGGRATAAAAPARRRHHLLKLTGHHHLHSTRRPRVFRTRGNNSSSSSHTKRSSGAGRLARAPGVTPTGTPVNLRQENSTTENGEEERLSQQQDQQQQHHQSHASGWTRSARPKAARPLPPPLGHEKLKDYDGPAEPEATRTYSHLSTPFPKLSPTPSTRTSTLELRLRPHTTLHTTAAHFEAHRRLMRELVAWYLYSRSGSPLTLSAGGCERGQSPVRPIKMCVNSNSAGGVLLDAVAEEMEEEEDGGCDVWKGIGTKGFTFALSARKRRSVYGFDAGERGVQNGNEVGSVPPPPPTMRAAPQPVGVAGMQRMRRVSLLPNTTPTLASLTSALSTHDLTPPRTRPATSRPRKLGRALGTSLGPWATHDPDSCDAHNHHNYHTHIAGSDAAYKAEHAAGWTSHERLRGASFVWDVATAEGGRRESGAGREGRYSFSKLFDRLLVDNGGKEKGEGKTGPVAAIRDSLAALGLV